MTGPNVFSMHRLGAVQLASHRRGLNSRRSDVAQRQSQAGHLKYLSDPTRGIQNPIRRQFPKPTFECAASDFEAADQRRGNVLVAGMPRYPRRTGSTGYVSLSAYVRYRRNLPINLKAVGKIRIRRTALTPRACR